MFERKSERASPNAVQVEARPYGVRINSLRPEERAILAQHRFKEFQKLLKASGCVIQPDPPSLAINFHTGQHALTLQINSKDPRQISLLMVLASPHGDPVSA